MDFSIKVDEKTWQKYMAVRIKGKALLNNPFTNKETAFTLKEREELGILGLLPPHVSTMEEQLSQSYENFRVLPNNLEKYLYLGSLHDRNETLFYRLLLENIDEILPIVYTPTVGEACQNFSHIYQRARGLYISYDQIDKIEKILTNFHVNNPSVIVITDGERILGLGDQGADGMGIPIGKLCLYTLGAGISPYSTLPIMLDVGTDNEERRNDPLYLGLRQKRIRGEQYIAFIDKTVEAVGRVFPNSLLQWEDFTTTNAIRLLDEFKDKLCTFNDDIQGTASVVLAFIYRALAIISRPFRESRILIAGAGSAAYGIANLIVAALREEGLSADEARSRLWICDSKGLVTKARQGLEPFKARYARNCDELNSYRCKNRASINLKEAISNIMPTILIGTSATQGIFDETVIKMMAEINEHPIIFPLSNPSCKSECTAREATEWSGGRAIVATGSPFSPVKYNGRNYTIGQCNNFFIFPGVGLGVTIGNIRRVSDGMFIAAAKALYASMGSRTRHGFSPFVALENIREASHSVACAVIRDAVNEGLANQDILIKLEETVKEAMWFPNYLPVRYEQ